MRGPLNPSLNESAGLLIDGFDTDSMLMMPHNPPEYAGFIEAAGYRKVKDLDAWLCDVDTPIDPTIEKLAARVRDKYGVVARRLNVREFEHEIERVRLLLLRRVGAQLGICPADHR